MPYLYLSSRRGWPRQNFAMFGVCEQELMWLEMSLRVKKSSCIPTGARYSATCCNIVNTEGQELSCATELRYLGVFIEAASSFKCSLDNAKRSFCRSFNSIFGRVGRVASNEVIIQLLKSKCLPVFYYYGMEACPLRNSQWSLDFVINSAPRKIFDTHFQDSVDTCREIFSCLSVESALASRRWKFLEKILCQKISYAASISVVNAIKTFWGTTSVTVQYVTVTLCWTELAWLYVYVFLCNCLYDVHISVCCLSSTEYSVNKD